MYLTRRKIDALAERSEEWHKEVLRLAVCNDGVCFLPDSEWKRLGMIYGRRGLGDLVHYIAQPIAKAIDAVANTNIQKCGGCKKRREVLNRIHL